MFGFWTAVSLVLEHDRLGHVPAGRTLSAFGGFSLAGWVATAMGSLCPGARLRPAVPAQSGRRGRVRVHARAFGDFGGFIVAWGYWISMWTANATLAIAFVGYAGPLLTQMIGIGITTNPVAAASMAIGTLWFLTAVNTLGVNTAGEDQVATTVLKLMPLVIVGIGGLLTFNADHFAIPEPARASSSEFWGMLFRSMTSTLFAFVGLEREGAGRARQDQDPPIAPSRVTIIGTLVTAVMYVASAPRARYVSSRPSTREVHRAVRRRRESDGRQRAGVFVGIAWRLGVAAAGGS